MPGKVNAVVGMRRAGKTTFLHQLRRESVGRGISVERLPYINFEDETLSGMDSGYLGSLVEDYYRRFPQFRNNETVTWFFDEIQLIPDWERFVHRLMDSEKVEIFITGSSASLLSREIATSLRGRAWEVLIHPFSFEEFLRHKHIAIPEDIRYPAPGERSLIEQAFMSTLPAEDFRKLRTLIPLPVFNF
ncbi:MAG: AAA family ATPase [Spirochaetota bacterium]|nr:AAA family ATPase [Spirochaetota bacterium]